MKGESKKSPSDVATKSKMRLLTGNPVGKSIGRFYQTLWYILRGSKL
jgi:hypothetical protein